MVGLRAGALVGLVTLLLVTGSLGKGTSDKLKELGKVIRWNPYNDLGKTPGYIPLKIDPKISKTMKYMLLNYIYEKEYNGGAGKGQHVAYIPVPYTVNITGKAPSGKVTTVTQGAVSRGFQQHTIAFPPGLELQSIVITQLAPKPERMWVRIAGFDKPPACAKGFDCKEPLCTCTYTMTTTNSPGVVDKAPSQKCFFGFDAKAKCLKMVAGIPQLKAGGSSPFSAGNYNSPFTTPFTYLTLPEEGYVTLSYKQYCVPDDGKPKKVAKKDVVTLGGMGGAPSQYVGFLQGSKAGKQLMLGHQGSKYCWSKKEFGAAPETLYLQPWFTPDSEDVCGDGTSPQVEFALSKLQTFTNLLGKSNFGANHIAAAEVAKGYTATICPRPPKTPSGPDARMPNPPPDQTFRVMTAPPMGKVASVSLFSVQTTVNGMAPFTTVEPTGGVLKNGNYHDTFTTNAFDMPPFGLASYTISAKKNAPAVQLGLMKEPYFTSTVPELMKDGKVAFTPVVKQDLKGADKGGTFVAKEFVVGYTFLKAQDSTDPYIQMMGQPYFLQQAYKDSIAKKKVPLSFMVFKDVNTIPSEKNQKIFTPAAGDKFFVAASFTTTNKEGTDLLSSQFSQIATVVPVPKPAAAPMAPRAPVPLAPIPVPIPAAPKAAPAPVVPKDKPLVPIIISCCMAVAMVFITIGVVLYFKKQKGQYEEIVN